MEYTLSKTDFQLYLANPKHLWAAKHDQQEITILSEYDRYLMEQGNEVQALAKSYFRGQLFKDSTQYKVKTEQTFVEGPLINRVDILVHDIGEDVFDIYEVKSSTTGNGNTKKQHKYDVTFQQLVVERQLKLRDVYLVQLNKEYVREGDLDLEQLFTIENMEETIEELRHEIESLIQDALRILDLEDPDEIESCFKPSSCPCLSLCHPDLPTYPIYDLSRLNKNKARLLRVDSILAINDVPDGFKLSDRQQLQVTAVKTGGEVIDKEGLRNFLSELEYPLHFLDYETLGFALPVYDGYRPQQSMIFQYSLHTQNEAGGELEHTELLVDENRDPGILIAKHLSDHMGASGSVIVWNKGFEIGRNKEMAEMYPEYADFLLEINERVFDLMEAFSKTLYIHPDFHGSASLKKVLPVILPDLGEQYQKMEVSDGSEAMLAWRELIWGGLDPTRASRVKKALLDYCKLDTYAMVKILEVISSI